MSTTFNHRRISRGTLSTLMLIVLLACFVTGSLPAAQAQGAAVIGTNFNSDFNSNHNGWTPVIGNWALVSSAYYMSNGVANVVSSIKHSGTYGNMIYQAVVKRTGSCTTCDLGLIIRGNPSHLVPPFKDWYPEYWFAYTNKGLFHVWYITGSGKYVELKLLTSSAAIVKNGWNSLKVRAFGPSLKFYINGTLVWSGSKSASPTGQVGIGFYRNSKPGALFVDSASLSTVVHSHLDPFTDVAPGFEIPGGTVHQSP